MSTMSFKESLLKNLHDEIRAVSHKMDNNIVMLNKSSKSSAYNNYLNNIEKCVEEIKTLINYVEDVEKLTDNEIKSSLFGRAGVDI